MSTDPAASTPSTASPAHAAAEALLAVRNAVKLGASLLGTWGISLGIQLFLPRFLGDVGFQPLNFADNFCTTAFVVLGLGLDTYIRKEIPVRPEHASDFFGATLTARLVIWIAFMAGALGFFQLTGRSSLEKTLVLIFGCAQLALHTGENLKALLHSKGTVDGLSIANVVFKLIWGLGVLGAVLFLEGNLVAIASSLLVSRALECVVLYHLTRKHLGLQLRLFEWNALKLVVWSSLPFYVNTIAYTVQNRVDVTIINLKSTKEASGWYGVAASLSQILMMVAPMIAWVMMPLFARSFHRSKEEFTQILRRSLELILAFSIPLSLAVGLGAGILINLTSGPEFLPATPALQILAPLNTVIYISIICAIALNIEGKAWPVTIVSLVGMVLNPILNIVLIPVGMRLYGPQGAGMACAVAQFITQCMASISMVVMMGKVAFDRRTVVMMLKSLAVCGAVIVLDNYIRFMGMARIFVDGLAYLALILVVRAVPLKETLDFARRAFRRNASPA